MKNSILSEMSETRLTYSVLLFAIAPIPFIALLFFILIVSTEKDMDYEGCFWIVVFIGSLSNMIWYKLLWKYII